MSTDLKTCIIAIVDLGVVALLAWRVTPVRFRQLKWSLAGAAAIFWGVLAAALMWGYWDIYYRYFYPEWVRSLAPVPGVNYAVFGLLLWWFASRLPGHPTINFCLLGGLESVPEHLWGIYGARILERVPVFQGEHALSILAFAFFEYILYWSIVLSLAVLLRRGWELWKRRGQKQVNILNWLGWIVMVLFLWSCAPAASGSDGGRIVFSSDRNGNFDIYVMNADGSGQVNLTNHLANDGAPAWSSDGKRIVFVSNRDGNFDIYAMNADGSGVKRLTNHPAFDGFPACSPDGTQIAFQSNRDGNAEIYVMNADGSQVRRLTHDAAFDGCPAWSPDGARIAFTSGRDGSAKIYVMGADGSGQTRLTDGSANDDYPSWSPDGTRIAFASDRDGNTEIYVMNVDGSHATNLTNNSGADDHPAWSRDGERITFQSTRDGNVQIYSMNADGTQQRRLTNNRAIDWFPDS